MKHSKPKPCKEKAEGCHGTFTPRNSFQSTCPNPLCGLRKAKRDREKIEAKDKAKKAAETREAKEAALTISERLVRAREQFQRWVRARDRKWFADRGLPPVCIMCDNTKPTAWHAAHFMSAGSRPELQFHPANCHLACGQCNFFKAQGDTEYLPNLIAKVGGEMVGYLQTYRATVRWDAEEIEEIRRHYSRMALEIEKT